MVINVLVELSHKKIDKTFSYLVPFHLISKIKVGIRVLVPFSSFTLEGFVLEVNDKYEGDYKLKEIIDVIDDEVILTDELLKLGEYIRDRTLSTLISSYQVMLPTGLKASVKRQVNIKYETIITLNEDKLSNYLLTPKQEEIINILLEEREIRYLYLKKVNSSVDTLIKKGILEKGKKEVGRYHEEYTLKEKFPLTNEQQHVVDLIKLDRYKTYLLHGVTGSGKTEVYMEIIEDVLKRKKNVIVLIPEISLTPQTVRRFKERFGHIIAVLHSALSDGEKYDEYRRITKGEVQIVIGARSAIFAPLKDLGAIIIDEEHSSTYKQENMPRYDATLIAKWRGEYHSCPVILGTATPLLETYARAVKGVYELLTLSNRVNNRQLPEVEILDMTNASKKTKYFSEKLVHEMQVVLDKGEQVILFLNKRGYSSTIICEDCGKIFLCPHCEINLTFHKTSNMLRCHYCGYAEAKCEKCPICHSENLSREGCGTEKIEEELKELFPDYDTVRMDFDTTNKKGSHERIISSFREHKYQILLGTQMIAKGLDFSLVTLVGVINADNSLNIPDFRSSETTFSLLNQVSGRSGRGERPGKVLIQTYNPKHYAITYAASNNYVAFYKEEMKNRKLLKYPPYYYLVLVKIKGNDYNLVSLEANKIKSYLENYLQLEILGPSVANPFKVNNIYRMNIIIKYRTEDNLYSVLNNLLDHYLSNNKLSIDIDFNPKSL